MARLKALWLVVSTPALTTPAELQSTPAELQSCDSAAGAPARRILQTEEASLIERLDCATEGNEELHNFAPSRRAWRDPPRHKLCCVQSAEVPCFRAVLDGRIPLDDPAATIAVAADRNQHCRAWAAAGECTKNRGYMKGHCASSCVPYEPRHLSDGPDVPGPNETYLAEQVQQLLSSEFGVRELAVSTKRRKTYEPEDRNAHRHMHRDALFQRAALANWTQLHADYYESPHYVFSAVLFTGEQEADETALVGGECGLADALRRDEAGAVTLARGLVVEPKRGRLVLFSGGGENYHSPLAVVQGRRTTVHAWFKCQCEEPEGSAADEAERQRRRREQRELEEEDLNG